MKPCLHPGVGHALSDNPESSNGVVLAAVVSDDHPGGDTVDSEQGGEAGGVVFAEAGMGVQEEVCESLSVGIGFWGIQTVVEEGLPKPVHDVLHGL